MNYKHLAYLLLTSPLLLHAATPPQGQGKPRPPENQVNPCESTHDLNRISIRHIESKGIGYNKGYTTLEGFFVPLSNLNTRWVPFLDLRGHIFNDGKPAANGGLGLRYIDSRVWGANIYYDYRKTSERNYNQVSFGFESLGRYLDYRINGYFPVGKDKGSYSDAKFDYFSGHSLYISRKRELALKGTNAEVGVHIAKVKGIDFYSALGPYYFTNSSKQTFGGEFRIGMDVLKILRIEGNTSYDHLFKWIGQGQISLSYAFTPKKISRKEKKGSCSFHGFVRDRAFQRVDKQEIVVVTTEKKTNVAINPVTGLPYVFWFVDNTSNSQGTYESPYSTLANAQTNSRTNDIIAVLPGDGTDRGMNNGITLKDGQKLWGMSVVHELPTTLGNIRVKPIASEMPRLSNALGGVGGSDHIVVNTNNNNDISGLRIADVLGGNGILIGGTGNYLVKNNIISTVNSDGLNLGQGIKINNSLNRATIINNNFLGADGTTDTYGVWLNGCSGTVLVSNNTFEGISTNTSLGVGIGIDNATTLGPLQCFILNNHMYFNFNTTNVRGGINAIFSLKTNILVADNKINSNTETMSAGMTFGFDNNLSFATLRNNQVKNPNTSTIPNYLFQNLGNASIFQINFSPDNIGKPTYSGF